MSKSLREARRRELAEWLSVRPEDAGPTLVKALALHVLRLDSAIRHVIELSPGTPDSVKEYLRRALDAD